MLLSASMSETALVRVAGKHVTLLIVYLVTTWWPRQTQNAFLETLGVDRRSIKTFFKDPSRLNVFPQLRTGFQKLAYHHHRLSIYCRGKSKKKLCTFPKMILTVNPIPHPLLFMAFCPLWLVEEVLSLRQNLGDRGIRDRWAVLSYKYIPNIAVRMLPANRTGLTFLQSHSL